MKTAYCMWRQQNMEEAMAMGIEQGLTLIYHFPGLWEFPEPHFNNVSCPAGLHSWCMACKEGIDGFTFRWYSKLWHEVYIKLARPGAWKPGQPEGCIAGVTFGLKDWGRLVSSMGELKEP